MVLITKYELIFFNGRIFHLRNFLQAVYEGTWARRDRWATLRSVVQAVWAFKTAHRYRQQRRQRRPSTSSLEDDDSDGGISVDSNAMYPTATSGGPTHSNRTLGSTDNLKGLFKRPSHRIIKLSLYLQITVAMPRIKMILSLVCLRHWQEHSKTLPRVPISLKWLSRKSHQVNQRVFISSLIILILLLFQLTVTQTRGSCVQATQIIPLQLRQLRNAHCPTSSICHRNSISLLSKPLLIKQVQFYF